VDRSGLFGNKSLSAYDDDNVDDEHDLKRLAHNNFKEKPTPLALDLMSYIKLRGPITVHEYMSQASNNAVHGYYQRSGEKIGASGDFVTAPEISQLFGEMVGIWCLSTWQSLGEPKEIDIIELGPGRGTLMKDILSVATKFPKFKSAINIHLVELSETMRTIQQETLFCSSKSDDGETPPTKNEQGIVQRKCLQGIQISWYHMLQQIPEKTGVPTLVIGQEFLDAFPVHQFVYTKAGWREKLVDIDTSDNSKYFFRLVLSNNATPAAQALLIRRGNVGPTQGAAKAPSSNLDQRGYIPVELKENDGVEISPLTLATCEDVAKRIVKNRGAALFVDYGENFTQSDSLRGFKKHKQVSILSEPGEVDITADVDFAACANSARRRGAVVYPAIGQGEFLQRLGIVQRVEKLIQAESTTDEQASQVVASLKRLIGSSETEMGSRFKVLALAGDSNLPPLVGF